MIQSNSKKRKLSDPRDIIKNAILLQKSYLKILDSALLDPIPKHIADLLIELLIKSHKLIANLQQYGPGGSDRNRQRFN